MRARPAEGTARPQGLALVMGSGVLADLIASGLESEGIPVLLQAAFEETSGCRFPSPEDADAIPGLKDSLRRFLQLSGGGGLVHPAASRWAERPELSLLGQEVGVSVVSAPPRAVSLFASKLALLGEADRLGIPNLVLSFDPIHSVRELERLVSTGGREGAPRFPFVLKSLFGGGRGGLCVIQGPEDLRRGFPLWLEQLRTAYGQAIFFVERYLEGARHVVVPFARSAGGDFKVLPLVDASLQSRYRKLIEFCPAETSDGAGSIETSLGDWAQLLAKASGFVGVGALEFLLDGERAHLIEGVARLTASFPLWERVAGVSAIRLQLAALEGRPFPVLQPRRDWSFAVAARIHAEDAVMMLPQPGVAREVSAKREWKLPGAAAELALSVREGEAVTPESDGFIGLLRVGARDRIQALNVAKGAFEELWIAGGLQTNERFLAGLMAHPWVKEGIFHAGFLDEEYIPEARPPEPLSRLFASICAGVAGDGAAASSRSRWVVGERRVQPDSSALKWVGAPTEWETGGLRGVSGLVEVEDGRKLRACAFPVAANRWQVRIGEWFQSVRRTAPAIASVSEKKGPPPPLKVLSLVSGRVHSLLFQESALVPAHEPVLLIESMRRLIPHSLPIPVRILKWKTEAEGRVIAGQELAEIEATKA